MCRPAPQGFWDHSTRPKTTYLYSYTWFRYPFWLATYLPHGNSPDPPADTILEADLGWKDGRTQLNKVTPIRFAPEESRCR